MLNLSRRTWIVLAALAALVAGLLLVPYFINLDRYRDTIASLLERETGKKVTIGELRLTLLPTVGFEVSRIRVSNPPDFPAGQLLAVERVRASVALLPLLSREIHLRSLTIDQPTLNLLVDERGRFNYETKPQGTRRQRARSAAQPLFTLGEISDVELRDVSLSYGQAIRGRIQPAWRLSGLDAELARLITDPARLGELDASVKLKGAKVEIEGLKEPLKFNSGEITVRQKQAEGKCEAALAKTVVHASFRIADIEKPVADFQLHSPEMNLGELAVLAAPTRARASGSATSGHHKLLGRGKVALDRVKFPPYEMSGFQAQARLYDDAVELSPVSARLYGGTVSGSLGLRMERQPSVLTLDAKVENVDTAKALAPPGQPAAASKVRGRFEANGRVSGPLGGGDLLSGLTGSGQFAVRDGAITTFSMSGNLMKLANIVTLGRGGPVNETLFSYFGGDFRLADGRIHSEQLRFESPQLEATGSGSSGFDGTLNYSGWASLAGVGGGAAGTVGKVFGTVMRQTVGRLRVPFSVRGTFANPQFLPPGFAVAEKTSGQQQPTTGESPAKPSSPKDIFSIFKKKR